MSEEDTAGGRSLDGWIPAGSAPRERIADDRRLVLAPLDAAAFAPFGEVIEARGAPARLINEGRCGRHHDLAALDFADGRAGISLFDSEAVRLPYAFDLVERHPLGSQAFLPMSGAPFLVIVAPDEGGLPGVPRAFLSDGRQGVNYRAGVWHGVLTPLGERALFAVVDRIGDGANLEEHRFGESWCVIDRDGIAGPLASESAPTKR